MKGLDFPERQKWVEHAVPDTGGEVKNQSLVRSDRSVTTTQLQEFKGVTAQSRKNLQTISESIENN